MVILATYFTMSNKNVFSDANSTKEHIVFQIMKEFFEIMVLAFDWLILEVFRFRRSFLLMSPLIQKCSLIITLVSGLDYKQFMLLHVETKPENTQLDSA